MSDHLRDTHFQKIAQLMERHTGIQLPPSKQTMIEGRLRRRVRTLGLPSLNDYGIFLFDRNGLASEREFLIDCVTTNKTDFFREPDHFDFLRRTAVPALLRLSERGDRPLKLWSAAASTGAEAFTLAMVLADMQEAGSKLRFSILATDISQEILDQARLAVYPASMLDPVPADMRRRYTMEAADPRRAEARIIPELRRLIQFEHLNLMDESYPFDRDVDVIFCRNVLIYFSRETQQAVLRRLTSHLREGGYLVLGHAESFAMDDKATLAQVSPTVFRRAAPHTMNKVA